MQNPTIKSTVTETEEKQGVAEQMQEAQKNTKEATDLTRFKKGS